MRSGRIRCNSFLNVRDYKKLYRPVVRGTKESLDRPNVGWACDSSAFSDDREELQSNLN